MEPLDGFEEPQEIPMALQVFPASVKHLMPLYKDIPEDFRKGRTDWNKFVNSWFFSGWPKDQVLIKDPAIDPELAFMHLKTILGSYEPKHEHKEAAVAWLASRWFSSVEPA